MKVVAFAVALAAVAATAHAAGPAAPVTFSKDVAPILQSKCQDCHQPNSIAPMSLITYQDARPWARSIKERVATRQMPPWHIDRSVGVQKFKNDLSLTDEQVETIVRWVDGGSPQGDPKDLPPPRQFVEGWSIPNPTSSSSFQNHSLSRIAGFSNISTSFCPRASPRTGGCSL